MANNKQTAETIFKNATHYPRPQLYFEDLVNAINRELVDDGSCSLIKQLINQTLHTETRETYTVPAVVFDAIHVAMTALLNNRPLEARMSDQLTRQISGCKKSERNKIPCYVSYHDLVDINTFHESIVHQHNKNRSQPATSYTITYVTGSPSGTQNTARNDSRSENPRMETPNEEAAQIIETAKAKAAQIMHEAAKLREDANHLFNNMLASTTRSKEDALREAQLIKEQAQSAAEERAEVIRRNAIADTQKMRRDAELQADQIRRNAELEADQIRADIRAKMEAEAEQDKERTVKTKLAEHIKDLRRQWEEEQREAAESRNEIAAHAALLKEDACTLSAKLGADLKQNADLIQDLSSRIIMNLNNWRQSLYTHEYNKLISFYDSLSGQATVFERELREAECSDVVTEAHKAVLAEHSRKLNRLRANLVSAMEAMSLMFFTPEKGESYNSHYHVTDEDIDDEAIENLPITQCTKPGILRIANSQESEVMRKAIVKVHTN